MSEVFFVQLAYCRRPAPPPAPKTTHPEDEPSKPQPSGERQRKLTPEQRERELKPMLETDAPRVRALFDLLDRATSKEPLPDGVVVKQGDIVAPDVLKGNPFPAWFDQVMRANSWYFDEGCMAYVMIVDDNSVREAIRRNPSAPADTKWLAEAWYWWVKKLLENERARAVADGTVPLADLTSVCIREDHRALLQDLLQ